LLTPDYQSRPNGSTSEIKSKPCFITANLFLRPKQLTIAKKAEIELDMEIKRGLRIPIQDALDVTNRVFQSIAGTLKSRQNAD
jgi:hypothetical protein